MDKEEREDLDKTFRVLKEDLAYAALDRRQAVRYRHYRTVRNFIETFYKTYVKLVGETRHITSAACNAVDIIREQRAVIEKQQNIIEEQKRVIEHLYEFIV